VLKKMQQCYPFTPLPPLGGRPYETQVQAAAEAVRAETGRVSGEVEKMLAGSVPTPPRP
jgi:hypothetical protein